MVAQERACSGAPNAGISRSGALRFYNHNAFPYHKSSNGFIVDNMGRETTIELSFKHGRALPPPGPNAVLGAISKHNVSTVKFLLSRGYCPLRHGHLPFELTCTSERRTHESLYFSVESTETIIKLLLNYGLDINARNYKQRTCLFETIGVSSLGLLENGAYALAQDQRGRTPLFVST